MTVLDSLYGALTVKAQTVNREITLEIVKDWVGTVGTAEKQLSFMSAALLELESGKFTAEELVEEILQLAYLDN